MENNELITKAQVKHLILQNSEDIDVNQAWRMLSDIKSVGTYEELTAYRAAEQDGTLLRLPCKVGGIIYGYPFCWAEETISEHGILEWKVACIHCSVNKAGKTRATVRATVWRQYNRNEYAYITEDIPFEDFGKTVFLTFEAAEAALKEQEEQK